MLDENELVRGPAMVGADKGYDTHDFIAECRAMNVVPMTGGRLERVVHS